MSIDSFVRQIFEDEDITFEQFQQAQKEMREEKRIETERQQKVAVEVKHNRELRIRQLVVIDGQVEKIAQELAENDRKRIEATAPFDQRELELRQEWHEKRLLFDEVFRNFNNGKPLTGNSSTSEAFVLELREQGAKMDAVKLPILQTPMSPSAQAYWERVHKPELDAESKANISKNAEIMAAKYENR